MHPEKNGVGVISPDAAFFVLALLVLRLFRGLLFGTVRHSGGREREGFLPRVNLVPALRHAVDAVDEHDPTDGGIEAAVLRMLGGIEGIMSLAAASGEDLATTSDIVTDALTAFGLSAQDSGHFADILAAASSNANTNVRMMGETFKYCAPIAGALGFSAEDVAEAIGLMANAGIKSTQAGTALRTIMNNLSGEVKITGAALGEVTIATTNADGSMRDLSDILADCRGAFSQLSESERAQAAKALVGKNAMSGFLALMNAAPADIEKLSTAIDNCDGTAAQMAETMQDTMFRRRSKE